MGWHHFEGRTDLHSFTSDTVNSEICNDEILHSHVKLFKAAIGRLKILCLLMV